MRYFASDDGDGFCHKENEIASKANQRMKHAEFGLVTCLAFEGVSDPFAVYPCASSAPSRGGPCQLSVLPY